MAEEGARGEGIIGKRIKSAFGIDEISSTKVISSELVLRCVSEGATYRQIKGIRQLTMTK